MKKIKISLFNIVVVLLLSVVVSFIFLYYFNKSDNVEIIVANNDEVNYDIDYSKSVQEIYDIVDNNDGTYTLKIREYNPFKSYPKLSEDEYTELMVNKKINFLGEEFETDGHLTPDGSIIMTNNKYVTFEVYHDGTLATSECWLYKGSENYSTLTISEDFLIEEIDLDIITTPLKEYYSNNDSTFDITPIYDFLCIRNSPEFVYEDGELVKITIHHD